MTTPEDPTGPQPNQFPLPDQPGAVAPSEPGWAAVPPTQPGWGAPPTPPQQPGWGAPPPQQQWGAQPPPQPGWGQPQPQPGWGQPQPGWGAQPGWGPPPKKGGHGCLIAALIVIGLIALLVGGCAYLIGPTVMTDVKLTQDLSGRASSVEFQIINGQTTFIIHLVPAYTDKDTSIACTIVGPDIRSSGTPNVHWEIVDYRGFLLADDSTACP